MIHQTHSLDLIRCILIDPKLYYANDYEGQIKDFEVNTNFDYFIITRDSKVVGCFQTRQISNLTLECHINISSEYWGIKGMSKDILLEGIEYFQENTNYNKMITDVPRSCHHVHTLLAEVNARVCGLIKDGVNYHGELNDLLLYEFPLRDKHVP